jgi:hypothetical protein
MLRVKAMERYFTALISAAFANALRELRQYAA